MGFFALANHGKSEAATGWGFFFTLPLNASNVIIEYDVVNEVNMLHKFHAENTCNCVKCITTA